MKNKFKRDQSICEKSMIMMTNIIKLSSLSIAKVSLGTPGLSGPTKKITYVTGTGSFTVTKNPLPPQFPTKRLQEPQSSSELVSYLMEPGKKNDSFRILGEEKRKAIEEKSIDKMASDYIKRVREKNYKI